MPEPIKVVISLDVEEEGLFGGTYECLSPSINNTKHLTSLFPFLERGVKFTLFCAYSALNDPDSRKILEMLRDKYNVEIGAHLHHWNTPPLLDRNKKVLQSVPAAKVPDDHLRSKLRSLFEKAADFQAAPVTSFRMGRWDLHKSAWPLLAEMGVNCDASVRPLHFHSDIIDGPDHYHAPLDPYWVGQILEVPLSVTPIIPVISKINLPALKAGLRKWGALAILPVEHPLWLMKLATKLHVDQGSEVISITWHSSEMMPGGSPYMRTSGQVDRFLRKIAKWLDWLEKTYSVTYMTMNDLRHIWPHTAIADSDMAGDWIWAAQDDEYN